MYELESIENLSKYLSVECTDLLFLCEKIKKNGLYFEFDILKHNGGKRRISAPYKVLKEIQREILKLLKKMYKRKSCSYGFEEGQSNISNASQHLKRKYICKIDLKDFFSQITYNRILGLLINKPYEVQSEVAKVLTTLVCHRYVLPQGAPTSPIISNMILRMLDNKMIDFAKEKSIFYTRFADDLTFSADWNFEKILLMKINGKYTLSNELNNIFDIMNLKINVNKIYFYNSKQRQIVTGIVVNNIPNLRNENIRLLRNIIHNYKHDKIGTIDKYLKIFKIKKYFIDNNSKIQWFENVLHGKILYLRNVKGKFSKQFLKFANDFNSIASEDLYFKIDNNDIDFMNNISKYISKLINYTIYKEGTCFNLKDIGLITSAHLFGCEENVIVDSDINIEFENNCIDISKSILRKKINQNLDYACIIDKDNLDFDMKQLEYNVNFDIVPGQEVYVIGFPNSSKDIEPAVIYSRIISKTNNVSNAPFAVLAKNSIYAGMSGGPVIDKDNKVIGIIKTGEKLGYNGDEELCGFVPIKYIIDDLKTC